MEGIFHLFCISKSGLFLRSGMVAEFSKGKCLGASTFSTILLKAYIPFYVMEMAPRKWSFFHSFCY